MKKKIALILACLMLCTAPLASCSKSASSYAAGTITENGYVSEWLGMEFVPGESMSLLSEEEIDTYFATLQDDVLCVEMMVENYTTGDDAILTVEKLNSSRVKMEDYVSGVKDKIVSEFQAVAFEEAAEVEIAGKDFARVAYSTEVQGVRIKQMMYLCKIEDRMVAITVTAISEDAEAEFLACFKAK